MRGVLLKHAGRERRERVDVLTARFIFADMIRRVFQRLFDTLDLFFAFRFRLPLCGAIKVRRELLFGLDRGKGRVQLPILFRDKFFNFTFPIHHHFGDSGLHAPGGKPALDLMPQNRADFIPHKAIQHAARLLRVD